MPKSSFLKNGQLVLWLAGAMPAFFGVIVPMWQTNTTKSNDSVNVPEMINLFYGQPDSTKIKFIVNSTTLAANKQIFQMMIYVD